ncbi:MAG TPA: DUF4965 domain-containing protein [Armatimonadota bacterium]|nr:DUF4965 domain-containing protein [Armatimonadota bacterium]HOM70828.1 DUF4965 domain-containing protein [Armatimonadota bacterium]HPP74853.1 DUF4965 domain-containing protein [Armatimonadota bacterium]
MMTSSAQTTKSPDFRPPATPLVTVDPYFSVWSMTDKLTDEPTKHWTGATHGMCGMLRIDGKPYRFISPVPNEVPAMEQISSELHPTRSIYRFEAGGVALTVTFTTPLLMDDLDIMARPASYAGFDVVSTDGKKHDVALYFDVTGEWVVNTTDQKILWGRHQLAGDTPLQVLRIGSLDQPVLAKSGDNLRIDWGYLHLVFPNTSENSGVIASAEMAREEFAEKGSIPASDDMRMPRPVRDELPVMACTMKLGSVGSEVVTRFATLVYDDQYSIEYFQRKLRPYWRRNGIEIDEMIRIAVREYPELLKRCEKFDQEMVTDALKVGGSDYADIVTTAYRQAIAAHKLAADYDGTPLFFSKECFSNGCIATVDVTYPSSPIFYLFNTQLIQAMMEPIFEYAEGPHWPFDFAPHDVGTYPKANGQVYANNAKTIKFQMPVEESGNMLIMLGVLAYRDGNADYAAKHWNTITKWASYLKEKGLDPENQLCTDDFAGHLAHNTNLSIKAITGLALYGYMADMLGKKEVAEEYRKAAKEMAVEWKKMALDEGGHYRLAFDQPGTWSMKYNLVWDKILGLDLFDPEIAKTEVASYKKRCNAYGLPLDNRKDYTKGDWLAWCATLADNDEDFKTLIAPLRKYLHDSESRVPFSDWHYTTDGKVVGFRARSVVGGVFIKMLTDPDIWKKWSSRAK